MLWGLRYAAVMCFEDLLLGCAERLMCCGDELVILLLLQSLLGLMLQKLSLHQSLRRCRWTVVPFDHDHDHHLQERQ